VSAARSAFAFSSKYAVENAKAHSTQQDERNALQVIENNQNRYAPLDTVRNARTTQKRNPQMVFRHGTSASLAIRRRLTIAPGSSVFLLTPPRAILAVPAHIIAGHKRPGSFRIFAVQTERETPCGHKPDFLPF
jgi:hypothetical protein